MAQEVLPRTPIPPPATTPLRLLGQSLPRPLLAMYLRWKAP